MKTLIPCRRLLAVFAAATLLAATACSKAPAAPSTPASSAPASSAAVQEQAPAASAPASSAAQPDAAPTPRPATTTLAFTVEGEAEEQPATLYEGEGWSLYIPDEGWTATDAGTWTSEDNASVWLVISAPAGQELSNFQAMWDDGHTEFENRTAGMVTAHRLYMGPDGTLWDACARYPQEAAEGFGARIPVILDTLAFTGGGADAPAADAEAALLDVALAFTNAYLDADSQAAQALLAEGYAGDEDLYSGTPAEQGRKLDATCLEEVADGEAEGTVHNVSVRFVDPGSGDSYLYLTLELVRQAGSWKVQFYGLEG